MGTTTKILVGLFYPLIVVFGVLLLASVQIRSQSGSAFDTWRLNYSANRALVAQQLQDLGNLRKDLIQSNSAATVAKLCLSLYTASGNFVKDIDPKLVSEANEARAAGKKADAVEGDLQCLLRGFLLLQVDLAYYDMRKNELTSDSTALEKAIAGANDRYAELIKDHQDFLAFKEMENVWYSKLIAITPYDLLVLLLVMFMGALGGMVRLLRDYGDAKRPNPAASDYFFIPLIGLVVAIGGYVLAKTGLLLLSSTKEETSLSPFMIGLVGIVSGLLAREVIDAIARAGARMMNDRQASEARQAGAGTGGGPAGGADHQVVLEQNAAKEVLAPSNSSDSSRSAK